MSENEHDDETICAQPHPRGTLRELEAWHRGAAEIAARAEKQTFYASFGAGYRRTKWAYGYDGVQSVATRHPTLPDHIDGRGYVEVVATDYGRARYLAAFYFDNHYSGLYKDTGMWDRWAEEDHYYSGGIVEFLRENDTLKLGTLDEDGLHWEAPRG